MRQSVYFRFLVLAALGLNAEVVPVGPVEGTVVALLPAAQRDVIALPAYSNRIERLKEKYTGRNAVADDWGRSCPLVLRWRATDGECGPWQIKIGKKEDLSDARVWFVSEVKPRLHEDRERPVFGWRIPDANLEVGETYHWKVWSNVKCTKTVSCGSTLRGTRPHGAGHGPAAQASAVATFRTDAQPPRWIALEGRVKNVRDLGGWRTRDGRRVRQGMAFRGQALNDNSVDGETAGRNRLTVEDVAYLKGTLGIRTDLDLRSPAEIADLRRSPLGAGVNYINRASPCYKAIFSADGKGSGLADEGKKTMADNFRVFCDRKNYPIFFHCIGGADRTGSLAYVLNAVLGVERHDLEVDWESTFYPSPLTEVAARVAKGPFWRAKEHFDRGFSRYGNADTPWNDRVVLYLLDCGVTKEEIERFRAIMLESGSEKGTLK